MPHELSPGSPADWLRRAESDLALAGAPKPPGVVLEDLCFHAQQAAEKALKAVLVARSILVPRTHSISRLLELIPEQTTIPLSVLNAAILTDYAVSTRYPGFFEAIDENELKTAIALAADVVRWARGEVGRPTSNASDDTNNEAPPGDS